MFERLKAFREKWQEERGEKRGRDIAERAEYGKIYREQLAKSMASERAKAAGRAAKEAAKKRYDRPSGGILGGISVDRKMFEGGGIGLNTKLFEGGGFKLRPELFGGRAKTSRKKKVSRGRGKTITIKL